MRRIKLWRGLRAAAAVFVGLAAALTPGGGGASAQPTSTNSISLQAKLDGVAAGPVSLTVQFYDAAAGGNAVGAPIVLNGVPVQNGIVSVPVSPVDPAVFNGATRYMGIRVNGWAELAPRTLVTSVPYALSASTLWNGSVQRVLNGNSPLIDTNSFFLRNPASPANAKAWGFVVGTSTGALAIGQATDEPSQGTLSSSPIILQAGARSDSLQILSNGRVGINTANPRGKLEVQESAGGGYCLRLDNTVASGGLYITTVTGGQTVPLVIDNDGERLFTVFRSGITQVQVLNITGGSDLAEPIAAAASEAVHPKPGLVMSIDPEHPGKLRVATEAYDKKVAGAISGANGLATGMVMGKQGDALADGDYPIAMTGRVWVYVEETNGVIAPGDRLTTSSGKPGYAMKATDSARTDGAVIGKAMTPVDSTTGMVLVLVNLQ